MSTSGSSDDQSSDDEAKEDKDECAASNAADCASTPTPSLGGDLLLLVIWAVGFGYRAWVALGAPTKPMHPDTIYQGIEVAHNWAYGSGFLASEFYAPAINSTEQFFSSSLNEKG